MFDRQRVVPGLVTAYPASQVVAMARAAHEVDISLNAEGVARHHLGQLVYGVTEQCACLFRQRTTMEILREQIASITRIEPDIDLVNFYSGVRYEPVEFSRLVNMLSRIRESVDRAPGGRLFFDDLIAPVYGHSPGSILPAPLLYNSRHAGSVMLDCYMAGLMERDEERSSRMRQTAELEARLLLSWRCLELSALADGRDLGYEIGAVGSGYRG